jgi:hypothetical protein
MGNPNVEGTVPRETCVTRGVGTSKAIWEPRRALGTSSAVVHPTEKPPAKGGPQYLYTMEFYAAMKKNEMLSFAGKWMELENIILSEVSLAQKTKNRMFSLICGH